MARNMLSLAVAAVLPPLIFLLAGRIALWWGRFDEHSLDRFLPLRWRARRAVAGTRPLQRLVADLRRLDSEFRRLERSNEQAKAFRMNAVALAYDDTLLEACLALDVPVPERPMSPVDRVQVQAELARAGLTW